jgi:hypothetical protein
MTKKKTLSIAVLLCCLIAAGCARRVPPVQQLSVEPDTVTKIETTGDLVAANDNQVYIVNTQSEQSEQVFRTDEPISSLQQNAKHMIITVYDPEDDDVFKGFYHKAKDKPFFEKIATAKFDPAWSYLYNDMLLLASANQITFPDGAYFQVGLYDLVSKKWLKQWNVRGQATDLKGVGGKAYLVGTDYKAPWAGVYSIDMKTGESLKVFEDPHPLDRVMDDEENGMFVGASARNRNEYNNRIYKFDPKLNAYSLFDRFFSNTKLFMYDIHLQGVKALITRYGTSEKAQQITKPFSIMNVKTKKQVHIAWDYRPIVAVTTDSGFAALGTGGEIALIDPNTASIVKDFAIQGLDDGKYMTVKRRDH